MRAGKDFADMCREQKTYDAYQLLEMDAYWGHKLAKCKVSSTGTTRKKMFMLINV